jgi:hypothetical protein
MKPDREIVVCYPDPPDDTYSMLACPQCLEPCWIRPACVELVAKGIAEPMCLACSVVVGLVEGPLPKADD